MTKGQGKSSIAPTFSKQGYKVKLSERPLSAASCQLVQSEGSDMTKTVGQTNAEAETNLKGRAILSSLAIGQFSIGHFI